LLFYRIDIAAFLGGIFFPSATSEILMHKALNLDDSTGLFLSLKLFTTSSKKSTPIYVKKNSCKAPIVFANLMTSWNYVSRNYVKI
jgi:hypothetical protein